MSSWNYRLWKINNGVETFYELKETYYNNKGEICACTDRPAEVSGESVEEIKTRLQQMLTDVTLSADDILVDEGFVFAPWSVEE